MMLEITLVLLKFLSIISAAVFGILGLLHDFKGQDGRITKWGGWSLFGVILSAIVAGATETFTFVKAGNDSTAQAKQREDLLHRIDATTTKSERVLHEVSRAVYPIEDLKVSFAAELPLESTEMKPLRDRLRNEAAAFLEVAAGSAGKGERCVQGPRHLAAEVERTRRSVHVGGSAREQGIASPGGWCGGKRVASRSLRPFDQGRVLQSPN